MKRFKEYMDERFDAASIAKMDDVMLGTRYQAMKFRSMAKNVDKDEYLKRGRELMGAELGRRARAGSDIAKKALNDRLGKGVDRYGQSLVKKTSRKRTTKVGLVDKMVTALIKRAKKEREGKV